jgi:hypothetical protein
LPTFSFGTNGSVSITTTAAATTTLTITTIAPIGCPQVAKMGSAVGWLFPWEIALACVLLLRKPTRSCWRRKLAMLLLLVGLTSSLGACGGGGGGSSCTPLSSGTTPGNYVITVTGTSGSVTANGSVSVIVQ